MVWFCNRGISVAKYIPEENAVLETLIKNCESYREQEALFNVLASKGLPVYMYYNDPYQVNILAESEAYRNEYNKAKY